MKMTKERADYVLKAKNEYCKDCKMFKPFSERCTLVNGKIAPEGHCRYWEAKANLAAMQPRHS